MAVYTVNEISKINYKKIIKNIKNIDIVDPNPCPEGMHDIYDSIENNIIIYNIFKYIIIFVIVEGKIAYFRKVGVYDVNIDDFEPFITPEGIIMSSKDINVKDTEAINKFISVVDMDYF